jgi:hypothetical protein
MLEICIDKFCVHFKGDVSMATVEVVVTGTIGAAAAPLTITPAADTLTGAVTGQVLPPTPIAQVTGGVAPYTYSMDPALGSVPNGLALAEDGNGNISISGTPADPAGTAISFGVIATDAAGATASASVRGRKIG